MEVSAGAGKVFRRTLGSGAALILSVSLSRIPFPLATRASLKLLPPTTSKVIT